MDINKMFYTRIWTVLVGASIWIGLAGCGPEPVQMTYHFGPAASVDLAQETVEIRDTHIPGDPANPARLALQRALESHIRDTGAILATEGATENPKIISLAQTDLIIQEDKGQRTVLRHSWGEQRERNVTVESVRLQVEMRANFVLGDGSYDKVIVSTQARYDSAADPRVRGPESLARADAPKHLPKMETILDELARQCVQTFIDAVTPHTGQAQLQFVSVDDPDSDYALDLVKNGKWNQALNIYESMMQRQPDQPAILGNAAMAADLNGNDEKAAHYYARAITPETPEDDPLRDHLARAKKTLEVLQMVGDDIEVRTRVTDTEKQP